MIHDMTETDEQLNTLKKRKKKSLIRFVTLSAPKFSVSLISLLFPNYLLNGKTL